MAERLIESKVSEIVVCIKQGDHQCVQIVVTPENESEFTQVIELPVDHLTLNAGVDEMRLEVEPQHFQLGRYTPRMDENVVIHKVV